METILKKLGKKDAKDLSYEEAFEIQDKVLKGKISDIKLAAFWMGVRIKREAIEELNGFLDATKQFCKFIETGELSPLDLAVNYDGKVKSWYVLPASIFIATGAGAKVVGHGAENVPSKFGVMYHQVLNKMGCKCSNDEDILLKSLELSGFAFYHQKFLSSRLYSLLPKRQEFYLRTYINVIEKMLNPFKTTKVIVGAAHTPYIEKYIQLGYHSGFKDVFVVKGLEGGIEPYTNKETKVFTSKGYSFSILPKDLKVDIAVEKIDIEENAKICLEILENKDNPLKEVSIITAGLLILAYGLSQNITEAIKLAEESLSSGAAYENLQICKSITS